MSQPRRRALAMVIAGAVLLAWLIAQTAPGGVDYAWGDVIFYAVALVYFLALGGLLMWKVPENRIGTLFASMACALGVAGISEDLADAGIVMFHAVGSAAWMGWIGSIFLVLNWYPTGRSSGGVWRWVEGLTVLFVGFVVFGSLFAERVCVEAGPSGCLSWVDNPIGIGGIPYPEYWGLFEPLALAVIVMSLAALMARFRRSDVVQRLQLKWFLFAAATIAALILVETALDAAGMETPAWVEVLNGVALLAIPIAVTLAILRHRLFDIDRIISRTVSYALVVGVLGLVTLGLVTLFATFLPSDDPLVVAITTLAAAALFNPVRRRVQAVIDRRFNRSRYDTQRVVGHFTETLQERVDPEEVVDGWMGVVEDTMQPAFLGVWVR